VLTAELLYGKTLRIPGEFFDHEDMPNDPHPFMEPFRRLMQRMKPTLAAHHIRNIRFQRFIHLYARFERGHSQATTGTAVLEQVLIVSWKESQNIVDNKRFNVSVDQLKPAYFTAQQEEFSVNKPSTVQLSTESSLSKKTHSILKIYPSAT